MLFLCRCLLMINLDYDDSCLCIINFILIRCNKKFSHPSLNSTVFDIKINKSIYSEPSFPPGTLLRLKPTMLFHYTIVIFVINALIYSTGQQGNQLNAI